jgi:hypothetical protein
MPVVVEWLKTDTGYVAGEIREIRVSVYEMPSLQNLGTEEFLLMRALLEWEIERDQEMLNG